MFNINYLSISGNQEYELTVESTKYFVISHKPLLTVSTCINKIIVCILLASFNIQNLL